MSDAVPFYLPVDNAAQIFIPNVFIEETTFSRIAVVLKERVDPERLQMIVARVIKRFPYFQVYLKNSFFGYVFKRTDDIPKVEKDTRWPNRYVNFFRNNFLFRVKSGGYSIALETSHILTDGFGTLSFLTTILAEYFDIGVHRGHSLIKNISGHVSPQEWKCGFRENFSLKGPKLGIPDPAYIPSAVPIPADRLYNTRIIMDQDEVRTMAKKRHVTMNVYLSAVYAAALQSLYLKEFRTGKLKKAMPIRLEIPVNLRREYPSECMRNFSYLYSPVFHPSEKQLSFDELVDSISDDIRHERHSGSIPAQIARNLRVEDNFFFKYLPSPLKQLAFRISFHLLGRSLYSGVVTNLGEITMPEALSDVIESFDVLPANTPYPGRNSALYSYNGKLVMNIASTCNDTDLEDGVAAQLENLGINFSLVYNRDAG